jgi:Fe2+ transport system protein B
VSSRRSWTAKLLGTGEKPKKPAKYRSKKTKVDGVTHDSGKEAERWAHLQLLEKAGTITELKRQVPFVLAPAVRLVGEKRKKPALRYFADATYVYKGRQIIEDAKSEPTRKKEAYRIKKHLMKTVLNLDITEV